MKNLIFIIAFTVCGYMISAQTFVSTEVSCKNVVIEQFTRSNWNLPETDTMINLLMKENPNIVVVDADVMKSTGVLAVKEAFPDRYISLGIAEQNMIGFAAGLAECGKISFAATFAVFTSMRAVEQFRQTA